MLVALASATLAAPAWAESRVGPGALGPPSIVLVVTDDQRAGTISPDTMPTVFSQLVEKGTTFSNAFVTDPQMRRVYRLIYEEFSRLVQKPDLAMP